MTKTQFYKQAIGSSEPPSPVGAPVFNCEDIELAIRNENSKRKKRIWKIESIDEGSELNLDGRLNIGDTFIGVSAFARAIGVPMQYPVNYEKQGTSKIRGIVFSVTELV